MIININSPPNGNFNIKINGLNLNMNIAFDNLGPKLTNVFSKAQTYLDNKVLSDTEPYEPMITGNLIKSATLGSVIGSGKLTWIADYSKKVYYAPYAPRKEAHPLASREWFEVSKKINKDVWINNTKKIIKSEMGKKL